MDNSPKQLAGFDSPRDRFKFIGSLRVSKTTVRLLIWGGIIAALVISAFHFAGPGKSKVPQGKKVTLFLSNQGPVSLRFLSNANATAFGDAAKTSPEVLEVEESKCDAAGLK